MAIDPAAVNATFLLTRPIENEGETSYQPFATGFMVGIPSQVRPDLHYSYVVTAAHVARPVPNVHIRLRLPIGTTVEYPVDQSDWEFHPTQDVAVAPLSGPFLSASAHMQIPEALLRRPKETREPVVGDDVNFIGLLRNVPVLADSAIPLVRSGTIGALAVDGVELLVTKHPRTTFRTTSHLIDCRAYGGMSGAPCFYSYRDGWNDSGGYTIGDRYRMLGLISGHFDDWEPAQTPVDFGHEIKSPVNTGVGVVTPIEYVLETLYTDELVELRKKWEGVYAEELANPAADAGSST